jgi:NADPH-dependent glutamate synthase beta subunit-like oxidoreductase/NAD-dependent dihydropyrimidine dehydrogenase PreA subunit
MVKPMAQKSEATENVENPIHIMPRSYLSTEANKTGSWRYLRPRYEEKTAPCSAACPAGEDIGKIEMLTTQGLFKEAWETILRENPFPGVCGRVCFHPCEGVCNRGEFDDAIAIHSVERFLADTAERYDLKPLRERLPSRPEKVAIAGAGPSGLAAAWFLSQLGYACDVFEAAPDAGGILRWGIPLYRLPLPALQREIAQIEAQGVRIQTGTPVTTHLLKDLQSGYHAVYLACGHGRTTELRIPGESLAGVQDGLAFLSKVRDGETPSCQGISAVIGGGNTAVDVARSIVRLGGRAVILYRRRRQDMPAFGDEVQMALDEGVELVELVAPAQIESADGRCRVILRAMKVAGEEGSRARVEPDGDKTSEVIVDRLFKATGAEAAEGWYNPPAGASSILALSHCTIAKGDGRSVLVYGGDVTNDIKSVVHAVASGKQAAMALDTLLREGPDTILPKLTACTVGSGPSLSMEIYMGGERRLRNPHVVAYKEINADYFRYSARMSQPRLVREERTRSFAEIDLRISGNIAMRETERCFNCGLCNQCDNCHLFCPDLSVIHDPSAQGRHINYDYCKGCGLCVVECPRNAMTLEEEIR